MIAKKEMRHHFVLIVQREGKQGKKWLLSVSTEAATGFLHGNFLIELPVILSGEPKEYPWLASLPSWHQPLRARLCLA